MRVPHGSASPVSLPIAGQQVTQIQIDHRLGFLLSGGGHLAIAGMATIAGQSAAEEPDPTGLDDSSRPAQALQWQVASAFVEQPAAVPLPLADAVIFLMAFLELNDEEALSDPDNVVRALENASYELQQLTREQRQGLSERAVQLALEAEQRQQDPSAVAFLRDFGVATGLLDEDD